MTIYMMVTNDKYELPLAVADTPKELAEMIGKNVNAIYKAIGRRRSGETKRSIYQKVEIKENEND